MTSMYETLATRNLPRIDALSFEDRNALFASVAYTDLFAAALRVLNIPWDREEFDGVEVNRILDQLAGTVLMGRALKAIETGTELTPWGAAA